MQKNLEKITSFPCFLVPLYGFFLTDLRLHLHHSESAGNRKKMMI